MGGQIFSRMAPWRTALDGIKRRRSRSDRSAAKIHLTWRIWTLFWGPRLSTNVATLSNACMGIQFINQQGESDLALTDNEIIQIQYIATPLRPFCFVERLKCAYHIGRMNISTVF